MSASTSATAVARLHALADTIQASPADRQAGRYTYHHLRRWILDTTGFPAPRPNTPVVVGVEIHRWEADDGSGRGTDAELDPDYHLTAADAHYRSTEREFVCAPLVRATYPAGNVSSLLRQRGSLASDPALLARQLAYDPLPDGPQATLRAVEELYTTFTVPRAVRAASLHVLAGVAGIGYQHGAVDRLGRAGVAVSLDARNLRYRLIFDPTTGQLLASNSA